MEKKEEKAPENGTVPQKQLPVPVELRPGVRPIGGLIPTSMEELWRFGSMVFRSGFAPSGMKSPEAVCVAIQMGMEIGLSPMQAVQNIAVINGRPSVWGDAALGLVEASGLLEEFEEWEEGERYKDGWTTFCKVKRRGRKASTRKWTWADAKQAGLAGKTGPWKEYPQRMMQMRPRSWALRDNFADVLRGLSIREEIEDIIPMHQRQENGAYEATQDRLQELRQRLTAGETKPPPVEAAPAPDPAPEGPKPKAGKAKKDPEPAAAPEDTKEATVECLDNDKTPTPVSFCNTQCEQREGCPSHLD